MRCYINFSVVLIKLELSEWIVLDCCTTDSLIPLLVTKLELLHSELLDSLLCIVLFALFVCSTSALLELLHSELLDSTLCIVLVVLLVCSTSALSCWRGLYCQLTTGPVSETEDSDIELKGWKELVEWLCCILLLECCIMLLKFCWFSVMVDWLLLCCREFVLMEVCMDWMLHKLLEGWS